MGDNLSIAVCDDNKITLEQLERHIIHFFSGANIKVTVKLYGNGLEMLERGEHFELIFLDIVMPFATGIDVAKRIREADKNTKIIFITNFCEFQNLAFGVHAFSYLLKPIKYSHIAKTLKEFLECISVVHQEKHNITIKIFGSGIKNIYVEDIYYIEYLEHEIRIATKRGPILTRHYSLGEIIKILETYNFEYSHKGYIVNLDEIDYIEVNRIIMNNQDIIPLAQKRKAEFLERFKSHR